MERWPETSQYIVDPSCWFEENGLLGQGVVIVIGRFPVQVSLSARLGLESQSRDEAPGYLGEVEIDTKDFKMLISH